MDVVPVLKFGGVTLQGERRFGPDEARLMEEISRCETVNEIYRLLAERRNKARAQRLREVATKYVLPLREQGLVPVIVVSAFDWATDKLDNLAASIAPRRHRREYARLLMSGELRANAALAMTLEELGVPARSMTGREAGIVTCGGPVEALIETVQIKHVQELIAKDIVPIVAGFQGYYRDPETGRDEVSILGRGGSNLTAVALAAALKQHECTMLSDVDGVYSKDPRRHNDAVKYDEVTADALFAMDPFPQVIQREAVQYAVQQAVDIWVRSGTDPKIPGTKILCRPRADADE
jgi:aspartate kinase